MHDTLGLTGRAGCVQKEKRVLGVHDFRSDVVGVFLDLVVPPQVAALGPRDIGTGALKDKDILDVRALLQSLVDDLLCADNLSATFALVGGNDD